MPKSRDKVLSTSRLYSDFIQRITPHVFGFAESQKLDKEFERETKKYSDLIEVFPEQWVGTAKGEYCFWRIFSNTVILKKFIKRTRDELMTSDVKICNEFLNEPWEYTLFVVDKVEGSIVFAIDVLTGEEFTLESPNVAELEQGGAKLFFALLFYNGTCYQSYGIILYFKGLLPVDFEYFSLMVNYGVYDEGGINAVMNRFPIPYMILYAFCELPSVVHNGEEVRYCSSMNVIPGFEADAVEGYESRVEAEGIIKFAFLDPEDPMRSGSLYIDTETDEITLLTTTMSQYKELVAKLPFDFGETPDVDASIVMVSATEQILGEQFPGTEYDDAFSDDSAHEHSEESEEYMENINNALGDVITALNNGKEPDYAAIAQKFECGEEDLRHLTKHVREKYSM